MRLWIKLRFTTEANKDRKLAGPGDAICSSLHCTPLGRMRRSHLASESGLNLLAPIWRLEQTKNPASSYSQGFVMGDEGLEPPTFSV